MSSPRLFFCAAAVSVGAAAVSVGAAAVSVGAAAVSVANCDQAVAKSLNGRVTNADCRGFCESRHNVAFDEKCMFQHFTMSLPDKLSTSAQSQVITPSECFNTWIYGHAQPAEVSSYLQTITATPALCQGECQTSHKCFNWIWKIPHTQWPGPPKQGQLEQQPPMAKEPPEEEPRIDQLSAENLLSHDADTDTDLNHSVANGSHRQEKPTVGGLCLLKSKPQVDGALRTIVNRPPPPPKYCPADIATICETAPNGNDDLCLKCDGATRCVWHSTSHIGGWKYCGMDHICKPTTDPPTTTAPPDTTEPSTIPPEEATTIPPEESTTVPPEESTTVPPEESTSVPPEESTTIPPEESTSVPPEESTSVPPEESTTVAGESPTITAPGDSTTAAPEDPPSTAAPTSPTSTTRTVGTTTVHEDFGTSSTPQTTAVCVCPEDETCCPSAVVVQVLDKPRFYSLRISN